LKRRNPDMRIGVGGCVAQLLGEGILDRTPFVDVLVGTHNFGRVPELVRRSREGNGPSVDLDRRATTFDISPSSVAHGSKTRAYVTVMEGCNHVCSFCVVPRTRGPEVCRAPEGIVDEVRSVAARGYPEVVLLGQTVNAYRVGETDFLALLERLDKVSGLQRLRFMTSHPSHVDERLGMAFRDLPRLCPYLHLPVQSGSDRILASMRRGYTAPEYLGIVDGLRAHVPELALSSDIIVGYPGETEADFQATIDLVERVGFDGLYVFAYSPRPGTGALRLGDDVPEPEKRNRLHALNRLQQRRQGEQNARRVGTQVEVLVESVDDERGLSGRTRDFRIVHLPGDASLLGKVVTVEVVAAGPNALQGKPVGPPIH
jgi:tRNA-2-methylthio-N6-dimethylallyladenosine synthase